MLEIARVAATGFVWVSYSLLGIALFWMAMASGVAFFFLVALGILGVLTLAAGVATSRIWRAAGAIRPAAPLPPKAKRDLHARLTRLIEQLDTDELVELETLLEQGEEDAILG